MGPVMDGRGGQAISRKLLGLRLRQLRVRRGMTREQAARVIRASESKISRLELGRLPFKERDVRDLLDSYGVDDPELFEALLAQARGANIRGWWQPYADVLPSWFARYVDLESDASVIRTYEAQFIPGLLQTEDYALAVTRAGQLRGGGPSLALEAIARRVELRAARQSVLTRPDAARLWAVIDEGAVRRQIGGPQVWRAQLQRLIELQALPNVTIQIMPFGFGGHVAQVGAFSILRFDRADAPDVVYLEHLTSALYLESAEDADLYHEVFVQLAVDSLTPEESAETLISTLSGP